MLFQHQMKTRGLYFIKKSLILRSGRSYSALTSIYTTKKHDRTHNKCIENSRNDLLHKFQSINVQQQRHFTKEFVSYLSSDFPPVAATAQIFEYVHDFTGLPWWGAIVMTTIAVRSCVSLPLIILSQRAAGRLEKLQPEIKEKAIETAAEIKMAEMRNHWSQQRAQLEYKKRMREVRMPLYMRDNCNPNMIMMSGSIQVFVWVTMSLACRKLTGCLPQYAPVPILRPELATEGTLWFQNLLFPDVTLLLPIIAGICNITITEISYLGIRKEHRETKVQNRNRYMRLVFSLFIIPIGAFVPGCMSLCWATSAVFGLVQGSLLMFPRTKRLIGVPKTDTEIQQPFQHIIEAAKETYSFTKAPVQTKQKARAQEAKTEYAKKNFK